MKKSNVNKIHKAWNLLNETYNILQEVYAEENSAYESKSERWQDSEKGQAVASMLGCIDEANAEIWNAGNELEDVIDSCGVKLDK